MVAFAASLTEHCVFFNIYISYFNRQRLTKYRDEFDRTPLVVLFYSVSVLLFTSYVSSRLRRLELTYAANRRCLRVGVLISSGPWSQAWSNVIGIVDAACETSSSQLIIVRHGVSKRSDNSNRLFYLAWYDRARERTSERASARLSDKNNRWRWKNPGRWEGTASENSRGFWRNIRK